MIILLALIFNGLDLITGIVGAIRGGEQIKSSKLRDGLFKKVGFVFCYTLGVLINYAEKFFYSDSLYVMQLLKCQKNDKKNTKIVKAIMGILSLALCTQISVGNLENGISSSIHFTVPSANFS